MPRVKPTRRPPGPRRAAGALAALAALALAAAPAPAQEEGDDGPGTWYARRLTAGGSPVRVDHLWSKGPRLRAEMVVTGQPIVTLVTESRYVMYNRARREGVSIERSEKAVKQDASRGRPFGNELEELRAEGAERVGTEHISGQRCALWRETDDRGRRELCVTDDARQLPIRMEVYDRGSGRTTRIHYLDWTSGMRLPESFLGLPEDVELERVSYEAYNERSSQGERVGPAPPLFGELLHGGGG